MNHFGSCQHHSASYSNFHVAQAFSSQLDHVRVTCPQPCHLEESFVISKFTPTGRIQQPIFLLICHYIIFTLGCFQVICTYVSFSYHILRMISSDLHSFLSTLQTKSPRIGSWLIGQTFRTPFKIKGRSQDPDALSAVISKAAFSWIQAILEPSI